MYRISPPTAFREHREIRWFKEVGSNLRTLGHEVQSDMSEAASSNDLIKYVAAPFAGAAYIVLKLPTNVALGALDKRVEQHTGYETPQTIKETAKELVTLHPVRAVVHGLNIIDSAIIDGIHIVGGFEGRRARSQIQQTRSQVQHTMSEPSYHLAA